MGKRIRDRPRGAWRRRRGAATGAALAAAALATAALVLLAAAGAAAAPDLSPLALSTGDLGAASVAQEGPIAPPSGSKEPLAHFNRVFSFGPSAALRYAESDVARYGTRTAASQVLDRLAAAARAPGFAQRLAATLKVTGLALVRVRSLGLGDQSLEVAYRYVAAGAAGRTEESLAFVRVGATVQRVWLVGRRVEAATVVRLARLAEARTRSSGR